MNPNHTESIKQHRRHRTTHCDNTTTLPCSRWRSYPPTRDYQRRANWPAPAHSSQTTPQLLVEHAHLQLTALAHRSSLPSFLIAPLVDAAADYHVACAEQRDAQEHGAALEEQLEQLNRQRVQHAVREHELNLKVIETRAALMKAAFDNETPDVTP